MTIVIEQAVGTSARGSRGEGLGVRTRIRHTVTARDALDNAQIPASAAGPARESIGHALDVARRIAETGQTDAALALSSVAKNGYLDGMAAGCLVAAGVSLVGVLLTPVFVPSHPGAPHDPTAGKTSLG